MRNYKISISNMFYPVKTAETRKMYDWRINLKVWKRNRQPRKGCWYRNLRFSRIRLLLLFSVGISVDSGLLHNLQESYHDTWNVFRHRRIYYLNLSISIVCCWNVWLPVSWQKQQLELLAKLEKILVAIPNKFLEILLPSSKPILVATIYNYKLLVTFR